VARRPDIVRFPIERPGMGRHVLIVRVLIVRERRGAR